VTPHPIDACGQCAELSPLLAELRRRGVANACIDAWLGGGVHAVRVQFSPSSYALLNLDGFGLYDDTRADLAEPGYDSEGYHQWSPPEAVLASPFLIAHTFTHPSTQRLIRGRTGVPA